MRHGVLERPVDQVQVAGRLVAGGHMTSFRSVRLTGSAQAADLRLDEEDLLVVHVGLPVRLDDIRLGRGLELQLPFEAVQPPVTDCPLYPSMATPRPRC